MTPTETILKDSVEERTVVDALGRRLSLRNLTALDKLRLLKAAGPELAMNQPWLAVAALAVSVAAIEGASSLLGSKPTRRVTKHQNLFPWFDPGCYRNSDQELVSTTGHARR